MDTNSILFESDRNIIGVSQIDDSTILITDEIKVIKYEVDSRRVLQEWRTETGCKLLTSTAVCKDDRYYATTDVHTIAVWKNSSMYISERCKKIKICKSCLGLVEHMGHVFAIHQDASLSLFSDTKKWCHTFSQDLSILSFNKVTKSHGCCDIILVVTEGLDTKVVKYAVQIQDGEVNVNVDGSMDCHSLLGKFAMNKSMKVLFLDELQSVVYGILKETKREGVYLLNERNESVKLLKQFESHSCGEMVQLIRRQDSILLVTSRQILEMNLKYQSPFLCNLISESQYADCSEENMMEFESTCNDNSFDELCKNAKAWLQSKGKSLNSPDSSSQDDQKDLQEFFSTRLLPSPANKVTTSEKLHLVPLFCAHPFHLSAKVFVEIISFVLSLNDDVKQKENVPTLLNHIVESTLPDDMLKSLSAMEFKHVQLLLEHLYNEMLEEKLDTEKVVDWISMLLDSHHTHIMVSKDLKIICLIKQLVDSLCEEAKEDSTKRFMEKLKFSRLQKRAKSRRGCYIEMFEL